jgi:hypothetical protein
MILTAPRQDLTSFRNDPFVLALMITGIDLTGASFGFAIRQYPDQAGTALVAITATGTLGAEGVRLVDVDHDADNIPISSLEIVVSKAHQQGLPAAGTVGAAVGDTLQFYYDLQITPANDPTTPWSEQEQTWLYGSYFVRGSANA